MGNEVCGGGGKMKGMDDTMQRFADRVCAKADDGWKPYFMEIGSTPVQLFTDLPH